MPLSNTYTKRARGARINPANRFESRSLVREHIEGIDLFEEPALEETSYTEVFPKTILNKVDSPDIGMNWSVNPYQGCEHGCVYCYARNSHQYWGFSAGSDFERKILVKPKAAELLEKALRRKAWKADPIMLSGNTDCYQPVEWKLRITRGLLEVLLREKHPVGIITKNSLILRDLDLLREMSDLNLVKVSISLSTLDNALKQKLEPGTASVSARLRTMEKLASAGIPVNLMVAPVIPSINSQEIFPLLKAAADAGVRSAHYIMVRLNGQLAPIFKDWLKRYYPERAEKVIHQIMDCHGGQVNDSRFRTRMKGEGLLADSIARTFEIARRRYGIGRELPAFNLDQFRNDEGAQLSMF